MNLTCETAKQLNLVEFSETEIAGLQKKCALQELQIDYLKLLLKFSHNRLEEATGSKKVVKEQLKKRKRIGDRSSYESSGKVP